MLFNLSKKFVSDVLLASFTGQEIYKRNIALACIAKYSSLAVPPLCSSQASSGT